MPLSSGHGVRPRLLWRFLLGMLGTVVFVCVAIAFGLGGEPVWPGFGLAIEVLFFGPLIGVPIGAVVGLCICIPHLHDKPTANNEESSKDDERKA